MRDLCEKVFVILEVFILSSLLNMGKVEHATMFGEAGDCKGSEN